MSHHSLSLQLLKARDNLTNCFRSILLEYDLTEQQWRVLTVIEEKGPIDFASLSKESYIHSPSLTGVITRMIRQGLVTKRRCFFDGRQFYINTTPKAKVIASKIRPRIEHEYTLVKNQLGEEKLNQLIELLDEFIFIKDKQYS
ncbi:MAG: homoprotocatechuate degradation operon regulator HpaR [Vibrio sp.]